MKNNNKKSKFKLIIKIITGIIGGCILIYLSLFLFFYIYFKIYIPSKVNKLYNDFKIEINKISNKQIKDIKLEGKDDWDPYSCDIVLNVNNKYLLYFGILGLEYDSIDHKSTIWLEKIESINEKKIYEIEFELSNFYNKNAIIKYKNKEIIIKKNYNDFRNFIKNSNEIIDEIFSQLKYIDKF